jgi:hypothetical protein
MKSLILTLCLITVSLYFAGAQSIPNGDFESWQTTTISNPNGAVTANLEMFQRHGAGVPALVTQVTDAHHGTYACKLENVVIGQDTAFGYAVFGRTGNSGPEGGFPYSQSPDSITGWYKSAIDANDSALVLVAFSLNGNPVYQGAFFLHGTHSSYTRFSFPLNLPGGFACDTVLFGVASSDPFTDGGAKPGSWVIVDNVAFVGTGITQQVPNSDFEAWSNISFEAPAPWLTYYSDDLTPSVSKTTDKYAGNYAAKVTTIFSGGQLINVTFNGKQGETGPEGGHPYNLTVDTLMGYYKYSPTITDTAVVMMQFRKTGFAPDWRVQYLFPTSTYTKFEIPINLMNAPDSVSIFLASSTWNATQANVGSTLYIDEVQFKSQPLPISIAEQRNVFRNLIYPNPSSDFVNVEFTMVTPETVALTIFDFSGKQVLVKSLNTTVGENSFKIDLDHLAKGVYTINVRTNTQLISASKFIVK